MQDVKKAERLDSLWNAAPYLLWYLVLSVSFLELYQPLSFLSAEMSSAVVIILLMPAVFISTFLTESRGGDFFTSALPLTLYTLFARRSQFPWAAPAASAALAVLDLPLLWTLTHPRPGLDRNCLWERRHRLLQKAAGRGAAVCIVVMLSMVSLDLLSVRQKNNLISSVPASVTVEDMITSSLPDLQIFQQDNWTAAGEDARIAGCSAAISLAARHLGLQDVPDLNVYRMREDLAGTSDGTSVSINQEILQQNRPDLVLDCCFHETYHIYTDALIQVYQSMELDSQTQELYLFRRLERYSQEWENYVSSADSLSAYRSQALEEDARAYAACITSKVLNAL